MFDSGQHIDELLTSQWTILHVIQILLLTVKTIMNLLYCFYIEEKHGGVKKECLRNVTKNDVWKGSSITAKM